MSFEVDQPLSDLGYMGKYIRLDKRSYDTSGYDPVSAVLTRIFPGILPTATIVRQVKFPDVSFYQGTIDFSRMRALTKCLIIRAGQNVWVDPQFLRNYAEAKKAGLKRGVYYFYDDRVSPTAQANILIGLLRDDMPEMEIICDWENTYNGPYGGLHNVVLFLKALRSAFATARLMLYTGYYWFKDHVSLVADAEDLLWLAENVFLWEAWYTSNPDYVLIPYPWKSLTHWQYGTPAIGVDYGVETNEIDMNYFNGTETEFNERYSVTEPPPPPQAETIQTHVGITYIHGRDYGTDWWAHIIDLTKVRMKLTYGFDTVHGAVKTYNAQVGINGGGWGLWPDNPSAPNEYLITEGSVKSARAIDGRPSIEVTKNNEIALHKTQPNFNTSWNVWGYDRIVSEAGVYNTRITDPNAEPRTFSGRRDDGKLVIFGCAGRSSTQKGLTFPEGYSIMKALGVGDFGNNDGGYSTEVVNTYFIDPVLNRETYQAEYRKVVHQVLFFADPLGTDPIPEPGDNMYRYSASYASGSRKLRIRHDAYAPAALPIGTVAAGRVVSGDELFVAPSDQYGMINGVQQLLNMKGDKWLHVLQAPDAYGVMQTVDCWTAIIHMGVVQMTLIDNGEPAPVYTPPPYFTLEYPDGTKYKYNKEA